MSRCDGILEEQRNASLIGAYLPQCEEDGSFSLLQCHASTGYCWCVNGQSGVPISDLVRFEQPSCSELGLLVRREFVLTYFPLLSSRLHL